MKKTILFVLVFAFGLLSGCSAISTSPAVTQSNEKGEYLSVVYKQTKFLGMVLSNRNVVVRCNQKTNACETLNLWDKDGYRIF